MTAYSPWRTRSSPRKLERRRVIGRLAARRRIFGSRQLEASPLLLAAVVMAPLLVGCRSTDAPAGSREPSARREAELLVEEARRDIERESAPPATEKTGLVVPKSRAGERRPLLVFLHGLGGSGADLARGLELAAWAEDRGFAFMAPEGHLDYSGRRFWNATESCCNFDQLAVDHVAQLREWLTSAISSPAVDPARVYLIGYSNGGFMAYRAACELSSLLRGIVSIAGAAPADASTCRPERKLSVVQVHGDADPIVAFAGGHLFADSRRPRHPSAEKSVEGWASLDGCSAAPVVMRNLDLDPRIPGGETEVSSFPNCESGRVELWRIRGGDHSAGLSRYSLGAIWEFIESDGPVGTESPAPKP
jgi:polyhydroxybutyrate depolymerase